jgi:hypothetical protein
MRIRNADRTLLAVTGMNPPDPKGPAVLRSEAQRSTPASGGGYAGGRGGPAPVRSFFGKATTTAPTFALRTGGGVC